MSVFKQILLISTLLIGENFCFKETYKPLLDNVITKYKNLVDLNIAEFGPLTDSENTIVNNTLESFELCSYEGEDDEEFLNICLCNRINCIELYCDLDDFLEFDDCKLPTSIDHSTTNTTNAIKTDFNILYVYDNLKKYEDSTAIGLTPIHDLSKYIEGKEFLIMRENKANRGCSYDVVRVSHPCLINIFNSRVTKAARWIFNVHLSYIINIISFFSLIIILLLFTLVKELGNQISGKCWIMFSMTSLCNYIHIIFLSHYLFNEKKDPTPLYFYLSIASCVFAIFIWRMKSLGYGRNWFIVAVSFVFMHILVFFLDIVIDTNNQDLHNISWMFHMISYFSTEFSIYFWLNMICFDAFYSTKAFRVPNANSDSKRFWVYCAVCFVIPFLISVGLLISIMVLQLTVLDIVLPAAVQRLNPFSTFMRIMTSYLKIIGSTEIIIKFVTVSFFLSYSFLVWKHKREIRNIEMTVHAPKRTAIEMSIFKMRMGILTFMILGSLLCNIVIYWSNVFGKGLLLCRYKMRWLENLNPLFEMAKRLNGLYILIFVFSGREYWRVMGTRAQKMKASFRDFTTTTKV